MLIYRKFLPTRILSIILSLLFPKGFSPRLPYQPTRMQPPSFSLIDNILCNDIGGTVNSTSGLHINDISDHKMIFTHLPNDNKVNKFIIIGKNNEASLKVFEKCTNFYFETERIPSKF